MAKIALPLLLTQLSSVQALTGLLIAIVGNCVVLIIISYRWAYLLNDSPTISQLRTVLRANFAGLFYNMVLPTSNGGDFVKWTHLDRSKYSKKELFTSMLLDRLVGVMGLFIVGSLAIIFGSISGFFTATVFQKIGVFVPTIMALCGVYSLRHYAEPPIFLPKKLRQLYVQLTAHFHKIPVMLLISIPSQFVACTTYVLLGVLWGHGLEFLYMYAVFPIISVLLLLPISVGGIGYKELLFVQFFSTIGLTAQDIIPITLTTTTSKLVLALLGWLLSHKLLVEDKSYVIAEKNR